MVSVSHTWIGGGGGIEDIEVYWIQKNLLIYIEDGDI